jgi:outer membrane receptor protein involved in Fe transport
VSDINPDDIEQIEIVRGPSSVLYGSDALGGVVNIVTRRAREGLAFDGLARGRDVDACNGAGISLGSLPDDGVALHVTSASSGHRSTAGHSRL